MLSTIHKVLHQWQHQFVHSRNIRNWQNAAIIGTLFLLLPTIDLGIKELNSLSKMLQINTVGVSTLMYWIPIYIIDLLIYIITVLILAAFFLVTYNEEIFLVTDIVQVLYIFLFYGACAIPFNYCIQLFTKKQQNVYLIVILINIFVILLLNGFFIFPIFYTFDHYGRYLFELFLHIIPSYNLACALSNYLILNLYNKKCSKNTCDTEISIEDPCCQNCGEKMCFKSLNTMLTRQSGQDFFHSVFDDLIIMLSMTIALHLILQIFEEANRLKWYRPIVSYENNNNTLELTVINEKKQVEEHMKFYKENQCLPKHVVLAAKNLTKIYGKAKVVQNANFNVYQRDCFGLLGLNGSGKSTIFKMLVGQTRMSIGKVIIYEYEFLKNLEMFIGMIGYCPQVSGLNDFMTGRQHLILYAALRGIPSENLIDEVNKWIDLLDLLGFENVKIKNCSWGIQRKISILQSLIGDLPLILLDEPSSGIDVIARQAICDVLYQIREMGRSLLIITHNMQEAEAMCIRVGILVDGRFVVIDSCENLKRKHDNNFILTISVTPVFQDPQHLVIINNVMNEAFPGINLKDFHLGIIEYELESNISHSNVFDILEQLRRRYPWITDFTIHQSSMDQVFLDLAIKNDSIIQKQILQRTKFLNFLKRFKQRSKPRGSIFTNS